MPNFPLFKFPFPNFYSPFYNKNNYYSRRTNAYLKDKPNINYNINDKKNNAHENDVHKNNIYNNKKRPPKYNSTPFEFVSGFLNGSIKNDDPVFNIFGIELYLDDIIILSLLFILYKEGVKDEMLFLALILLLLT